MSDLGDKLRALALTVDRHPEWTFVIALAGETLDHVCYSEEPVEANAFEELVDRLSSIVNSCKVIADYCNCAPLQ